jgi:hypothetical protein
MRDKANTVVGERMRSHEQMEQSHLASAAGEIMFTPLAFGPIHVELCCAAFAKKKKRRST